jgi:hypothetical protein
MKNNWLLLLFSILWVNAPAQKEKPNLFAGYPKTIKLNKEELAKVFTLKKEENIKLTVTADFIFEGKISEILQRYKNMRSFRIQSPAFKNAIFEVSEINNNGRIVYSGLLMHNDYDDGYLLAI